jgi:hypothetical protein
VTQRTKYPLDFGTISTPADIHLTCIKNLQDNFRNGIPIEQTTSIQRSGGAEKVMSASLVKFSDFGVTGKVYPNEYLSLKTDQGLTDFVPSGSALQSSIYKLTHDTRYDVDQTIVAFDEYHAPLTSVGKDRINRSTHWGFKKTLPVVQITNSKYNEFVFSNFETDSTQNATGYEFEVAAHSNFSPRTGNSSMYAGTLLPKTLQKAAVNKYRLSFWFKKHTASVVFNITLKDASGASTIRVDTLHAFSSGTDWRQINRLIDVSTLPSSFRVEIQGIGIPVNETPLVDDVAFYPENAEITSYTYDIPFGQNSITDATASTVYSVFDAVGRQRLILDQKKNVIQKTTYKFPSDQMPAFTATIAMTNPYQASCPVQQICIYDYTTYVFTANDNDCITDGVTYRWKFDGGGWVDGGKTSSQTYNSPGSHTIWLEKSHPLYSPVTTSISFTVTPKNLDAADMCARGVAVKVCNTVTETYSCSLIGTPPQSGNTTFMVTDLIMNGNVFTPASGETLSYQWYQKAFGLQTWSAVGTNAQTIELSVGVGYDIKCVVTTSLGRIAETGTMTVTKLCN